jgi:NADPH:quinone reductase-like Zn-dependent oxidoreductase
MTRANPGSLHASALETALSPELVDSGGPAGALFALAVSVRGCWHILFRVAAVRPAERVLVHMAAGGVGTAALQLCRTVDGVETFGTASAASSLTPTAASSRTAILARSS